MKVVKTHLYLQVLNLFKNKGDCAILYEECAFLGCHVEICDASPELDEPFRVGYYYFINIKNY
jgi:hypothetical protein